MPGWNHYSTPVNNGPTVLSKDRACTQYGLTLKDLENIPSSCRSYMGNYYPVWKVSDLEVAKTAKRRQELIDKQKELDDKENALIQQHGVEGLKRMREEEAAERAKKAAAEQTERIRAADLRAMATEMTEIRLQIGPSPIKIPEIEMSLDSKVPKPQAKEMFGLSETKINRLHDYGPAGRAKSSYLMSDLITESDRSNYNVGSRFIDKLAYRQMNLKSLKAKRPDLVVEAAETSIASLKLRSKVASDEVEACRLALAAAEKNFLNAQLLAEAAEKELQIMFDPSIIAEQGTTAPEASEDSVKKPRKKAKLVAKDADASIAIAL